VPSPLPTPIQERKEKIGTTLPRSAGIGPASRQEERQMLTVTHLKSSAEAISKYLRNGLSEADDAEAIAQYYGTDNSTFWVGRLADDFSLTGQPVDDETFQAMLNGTLPDGSGPDQMHDKNRRLGSDFTFSCPKSLSIGALALGKTELIEDHHAAVVEAMNFVQERLIYARRGKGSTIREDSPRVAIAVFTHIDSRPVNGVVAPDLHSHAVIPNLGRRADGTIGGIQVDAGQRGDLFKLADGIYKATLAERLQKRMIALRPTVNGFELASISDEVIRAWSPRKRQIDDMLAKNNKTRSDSTEAERQWANLATRESKQDTRPEEYIAYWRRIAREDGLIVEYDTRLNKEQPAPEELALNALGHLSERSAVFSQAELQAQALLLGCPYHSRETMERAAHAVVSRYAIELEGDRLTTYQHAARAEYTLDLARAASSTAAPLADQDRLPAILAAQEARQGFQYSADQREAIRSIATSQDGIMTLVGAAGAGKTTALAGIAKVAHEAGIQVVGLAPSHVAKDALAGSLGIEAETLSKWLQAPPAGQGPRLLILDEAGLSDTASMSGLFASLGTEDRLLLVGDPRQLSPVAAGQPFADLLEQRPDTPVLGEIRRQHDMKQREIATLYSQGRGREAAEKLLNFTQEVAPEALIQSAASAYLATNGTKVLLASKNATVQALNSEIAQRLHGNRPADTAVATIRKVRLTEAQRERMSSYPVGSVIAKKGEVHRVEKVDGDTVTTNRETITRPWERGWDLVEAEALDLWVGDPVLATDTLTLTVDGKPVTVRNGTVLTVMGAGPDGGAALALPDGRVGLTDARHAVPLAYGWARTVHRSQGQTVDHAIVVDDGMTGASIGYVASSRQKSGLAIFTSDRESLTHRLSEWAAKAPLTPTKEGAEKLAAARQEGAAYARQQAMPWQQAAAARRAAQAQAAAEAEKQAKIEAERQARIEAERQRAEAARQKASKAETIQVEAPQPAVYWGRRP
jgi:conjugative relaxase-like TrwC/TraI family protein